MRTVSLISAWGTEASNSTCTTTDPWTTGIDPWASFAKTAVAKKAKKEELGEDLADGFGLGATYSAGSSSAASSAPMRPQSSQQ